MSDVSDKAALTSAESGDWAINRKLVTFPRRCADRRHGLHPFGDMVYTSSRAWEDRDVSFAERQVSDLRAEFVALAQQPGANRRALCQRFGISAPTGCKWLQRFAAEGPAGLADRSRRPHHSPRADTPGP